MPLPARVLSRTCFSLQCITSAGFVALLLVLSGCGSKNVANAPVDFTLAASPATIPLTGGGPTQQLSLTSAAVNGFSSPIQVSISGLPPGVTAQPATFTLSATGTQAITLSASASAAVASVTVTLTGSSGALSHTATVALTVAPAPDFSLSITPSTVALTPGGPGQQVTLLATAVNGFAGSIALSALNLPAGISVTPALTPLTPGAPEVLTLTAAASATPGSYSVTTTGQSGALSHTAPLAFTISAPPGTDATTYHYDNARTGLNPNETTLTPANVNPASFGKLMMLSVDGKVDAEPLYLSGMAVGGQAHNVLYTVTEHDSVYAFDADSGATLWKATALGSGETTSDDHGCGQITPEIGITSTPVIDRRLGAHGAIFVVAMSKDGAGSYHQRLHALDLTTGAELAGSPVEIAATYPGTGANSSGGKVIFAPGQYAERVGLLLLNGEIYMGWTSHCDIQPYTGWVMAYSENTLQQTSVLNLTPNGSEGSIWMSGAGLAADASGNIYFLDANGTLDPTVNAQGFPVNADYGNAIVKASTANNTLAVADYFEPYNSISESKADVDLGSGGALLLPDLTDASGTVRHLVVGAGKDGNIYIANRDNLGKYNPANNNSLYQELSNTLPNGAWSMPAYFNGTVYCGGVNDHLKAFPITAAKLASTPASESATSFGYPGATPGISSNGIADGIVWAVQSSTGAPAVLHAYDATDLAKELYNSNEAAGGRDSFGNGNKFITPLIVNGKVYVGTPNAVAVFGLLGH